jgi:hypothetical protein
VRLAGVVEVRKVIAHDLCFSEKVSRIPRIAVIGAMRVRIQATMEIVVGAG